MEGWRRRLLPKIAAGDSVWAAWAKGDAAGWEKEQKTCACPAASPAQNKESEDADTPHIDAVVVARLLSPLALDDLGRQELPRAADGEHSLHRVGQEPRKTKISHHRRRVGSLVTEQDVLGLEVAVAHAGAVQIADGGEQADDQAAGLVRREGGDAVGTPLREVAPACCGCGMEGSGQDGMRSGGGLNGARWEKGECASWCLV
eukprot:scaffold8455_cov104-Isochrysis_galbana.AAC.8